MFRKVFVLAMVVFLVLGFWGCGSDSSSATGPDTSTMPDIATDTDYINTFDTVDTAATNSSFDEDYPDTYNMFFGASDALLYMPIIFFDIYEDMKNADNYNTSENRWEVEVPNPFGNDPATVTLYGEYEGDVFRVHATDDPEENGFFVYPDGGVSVYLTLGTDNNYFKMEIYRESGYYYGFIRFNPDSTTAALIKFKFEDQTPCEDFQLYGGEYSGSTTVSDYELIRNRQVSPSVWYDDDSKVTVYFQMSWNGTEFSANINPV